MSRPGFHENGTPKTPGEWTLAEYIATRREFDGLTVQAVWRALLRRGKITAGCSVVEVADACAEARRIVDVYLA